MEGNYFDNVEEPMTNRYAGPQGRIVQRSNTFVSSGPPVVGGSVQEPSLFYSYTLDNAADVKTTVMQGAGVDGWAFKESQGRAAAPRGAD